MVNYFPVLFSSLDDLDKIKSYTSWIIPAAQKFLNVEPNQGMSLIGIEARFHNKVVGFALAQYFEGNHTAQLYSLLVDLSYRNQGIGTTLFTNIQEFIKNRFTCLAMGFEYPVDPFTPIMEKILKKIQWPLGKYYFIKCHFVADQFSPEWYVLQIQKSLPKDMHFFLWSDLSDQDRKRIIFEENQGMFLPYLSPIRLEKKYETTNSLGLRYKDKVVGWCLTERIDTETIRYSILYIEKEFHLLGYAIRLLAESIKLQKQNSKVFSKALFEVNYDEVDRSWWLFVNKRLIPFAEKTEKMKWTIKVY